MRAISYFVISLAFLFGNIVCCPELIHADTESGQPASQKGRDDAEQLRVDHRMLVRGGEDRLNHLDDLTLRPDSLLHLQNAMALLEKAEQMVAEGHRLKCSGEEIIQTSQQEAQEVHSRIAGVRKRVRDEELKRLDILWATLQRGKKLVKRGESLSAKGFRLERKVKLTIKLIRQRARMLEVLVAAGEKPSAWSEVRLSRLQDGRVDILKSVIDQPAFCNAKLKAACIVNIAGRPVSGSTRFGRAVVDGCVDFVSVLLALGANIEARDDEGLTPLFYACLLGDSQMVELLIDSGANVNALDSADMAILQMAHVLRNKRITELLLENGANADYRCPDGLAALHMAAVLGSKEAVELLLAHGAQLDVEYNGYSPLDFASAFGRQEVVLAILDHERR